MNILLWVDHNDLHSLHTLVKAIENSIEHRLEHINFSVYFYPVNGYLQISMPVSTYYQIIDLPNVTFKENAGTSRS